MRVSWEDMDDGDRLRSAMTWKMVFPPWALCSPVNNGAINKNTFLGTVSGLTEIMLLHSTKFMVSTQNVLSYQQLLKI